MLTAEGKVFDRNKVLLYMIGGAIFGLVYACFEYAMKLGKEDEQLLVPLLMRVSLAGAMILATVAIFEVRYKTNLLADLLSISSW